jgi:hypothetical protein
MIRLQVILTYLNPSPKQYGLNSWEVKPSEFSDAMTLGTDEAESTLPQRASTVKAVLGSITGTSQTKLEKGLARYRIIIFPNLLWENLPT